MSGDTEDAPIHSDRPRGITEIDGDVRKLREMHRSQLRFYQQEQRAIWTLIKPGRKDLDDIQLQKLRAGCELLTNADMRKRLAEIDVFLVRNTRGALDVLRAQEKAVGSSDDEQLAMQIKTELIRSAHTFTPDDWALLDEVRRLQATQGSRAASMKSRYPTQKLLKEQG